MSKRAKKAASHHERVRPVIVPKNHSQASYLRAIRESDVTFAVGPAGTGKTFLAAATAAQYLEDGIVERIVVCRPIVEASGEELGFLPGNLEEKCDPYLRPIFDGLLWSWDQNRLDCMLRNKTVEVAPLAYMRGRTFKNAFIIADEFQNADVNQMYMLLTRFGEGSKMAITGDPTQRDRPVDGLEQAWNKLKGCPAISFVEFKTADVVRHKTVENVINLWFPKAA